MKSQLLPGIAQCPGVSVGCDDMNKNLVSTCTMFSFPVLICSQNWPEVFHDQSRSALVLFQN